MLWLLTRMVVSKWKCNTLEKKHTIGHDGLSPALVISRSPPFSAFAVGVGRDERLWGMGSSLHGNWEKDDWEGYYPPWYTPSDYCCRWEVVVTIENCLSEKSKLKYMLIFEIINVDRNWSGILGGLGDAIATYVEHVRFDQAQSTFIFPEMLISIFPTLLVKRKRNKQKKHTVTRDGHDGPSPTLVIPCSLHFSAVAVCGGMDVVRGMGVHRRWLMMVEGKMCDGSEIHMICHIFLSTTTHVPFFQHLWQQMVANGRKIRTER